MRLSLSSSRKDGSPDLKRARDERIDDSVRSNRKNTDIDIDIYLLKIALDI